MRLIDADKLREYWLYNGLNEKIYDTNDVLESIDEQPDVDPESLWPTAHWISVKDRLPKPQTEVLAFRRGIMYLALYDNEIGRWASNEWGFLDAVTHWMPLPEPQEVTL